MYLSQFLNMLADACFILITPIGIWWLIHNWTIKED